MLVKAVLGLIGLLYVALAVFCSLAPQAAARKVGFDLIGGSGQSEFLVVYGGLELALGIVFLLPLFREDLLEFALLFCLILHGCLVVFRTISYLVYSDISGLTHRLAIGEWVILLVLAAAFVWTKR